MELELIMEGVPMRYGTGAGRTDIAIVKNIYLKCTAQYSNA
jgi:hypothetical protein